MSRRRLPVTLQIRLVSTSVPARLRAAAELERLAAGVDLPLAAVARDALVRLAQDRVPAVGAAATEGLGRLSPRLNPGTVDFGEVAPGAEQSADVLVEGALLARAGTVTVSDATLRAGLTGNRLRVTWTPGAGVFHGSVTLHGPGGSASVLVTGRCGTPSEPEAPPRRVGPLVVVGAVVVLLLVGLGLVVRNRGGSAPAAAPVSAAPLLAPRRTVSSDRPEVLATVRVGGEPEGVAVAPDGRTVYVADQSARALVVVDVRTRRATRVPLRGIARFVAVARDGAEVFVSMYDDDLSGSGVAVVDVASRSVVRHLNTGVQPYDLAVAPDGRLWVPIHGGSGVEIFAAGARRRSARVPVLRNPHSVRFSAERQRAFTPDHESDAVSVIDTRTNRLITSVKVSRAPHSLAVTPDGDTVVVAAFGADAVNLVDAGTLARRGPIRVGRQPQSVAVAADGLHAYTVNEGDDTVSVVRLRDGKVTATVAVGRSPRTVAVSPDGRFAYVSNGGEGSVSVLDLTSR
ncbi:YncE family protein [Symbioplanes lichenis]|uniref:YncE family protein n=1 Tax=Symbioplanes lichenis TaxID=1629072 RepID=UPI0027397623|nr:beta-propeller fold lactonase family protein [Actinoplanes lichenis]